MNTSIRATIRALVKPKHRLSCSRRLWRQLFAELHRRGGDRRESGAFLLGRVEGDRRRIERVVYYDDLDPHSLDTGIVTLDGAAYEPLFALCHELNLIVVADVHTHGGSPWQSEADRTNPAIGRAGHLALIVPGFARLVVEPEQLGLYQYQGDYCWCDRSGKDAARFFYIGWL